MAQARIEIDLPATALRLRLSRDRALRLAFNGEIRAERRGGRWWFDAADVERVAAQRRRDGNGGSRI
jgi:hypothetical protein